MVTSSMVLLDLPMSAYRQPEQKCVSSLRMSPSLFRKMAASSFPGAPLTCVRHAKPLDVDCCGIAEQS